MKYKSEICEAMYQDALADFEVGAISEARMREYDEMCLVQEPETARSAENSLKPGRTAAVTA
jgi:DNA-binding transcriptional regulator YiaG